jgi:hypothetical protein
LVGARDTVGNENFSSVTFMIIPKSPCAGVLNTNAPYWEMTLWESGTQFGSKTKRTVIVSFNVSGLNIGDGDITYTMTKNGAVLFAGANPPGYYTDIISNPTVGETNYTLSCNDGAIYYATQMDGRTLRILEDNSSTSLSQIAMRMILFILMLIGIAASMGWFIIRMQEGYSVIDIWKYFIILIIWVIIFIIFYLILSNVIMGYFYPTV